ncbi:VWA domain-containing protein [Streptomyces sp. NPDC003480]
MGILTLLRNAFGRSRKGRTAEGEPSRETTAATETATAAAVITGAPSAEVPAQSTGRDDEHELVSAAFDNVTVPRQASPQGESAHPTTTEPEPKATAKAEQEPAAEEKPEPEATAEPVAEEAVAEPEPVAEEKPEPEATAEAVAEEAVAEPKPVAEETPEPEAPAEAEPEAVTEPEHVAEETPEAEATEAEPEPMAEEKPEPVAEPGGETAAEATAETPEPGAAVESAPAVEAEPEVTPEPEAAKPETEAPAEAAPEPETGAPAEAAPEAEPEATAPQPESAEESEPKPEAVAETTPEPASEPTPEPVAETTPEPEAKDPEPEAEPEAPAHEPVAAAGEEAPNTSSAPTDAEPQTPADTHDENETEADAEAETEAKAETEAEAQPALSLAGVKSRAPGLTTAYKAAATVLDKHGLTGTRAKVYLVLDRSASMRPYYKDGSAQALGEQALALAAHLDPEATVHVVFFSTELDGTGELTLAEHENRIDDLHAGLGRMGRTSYHAAVEAVLGHHDKCADPALPALVIFQTDGAPDAKTPATQSLTDAAKSHPALFFSFIAFGDPENKAFDYLRKLKSDNTAHFLAGETPRELTDAEVYEGVLANWRP